MGYGGRPCVPAKNICHYKNCPLYPLTGPAVASLTMTKEENLEVQEKERHDCEEQEEGKVQKEEEEALTEEEEEEEGEYELEEEKEGEQKAEVEDEDEQGEEEPEEREEQEVEEDPLACQECDVDPEPELLSVSEYQSPVHEPRRRAMVHPSAQAPLPKDYSTSHHLKYTRP